MFQVIILNSVIDMEYLEVIKFVPTCWISLEPSANREFKKYQGFKSYFPL